MSGGSKVRAASGIKQKADVWQDVTVVLEGGKKLSYYVDGRLVSSAETTLTASAVIGTENISGYLAKSLYSDPNFGGAIDDFKVWNRALSSEEINSGGGTS